MASRGAALGLTFDGDADRCMLAGAHNNVIDGDAILLIAARDLKARGLLTADLVVATTMSNMGLEAALKRSGIRMLRAPVGDRYVLEEMLQQNAALGGEQSGHILLPHLATTGDGLLTALVVLDLIARSRQSIEDSLPISRSSPRSSGTSGSAKRSLWNPSLRSQKPSAPPRKS